MRDRTKTIVLVIKEYMPALLIFEHVSLKMI